MYAPNSELPCVYAIQGENSKQATNYFVHKMDVDDMPDHLSRPAVRKSSLILALSFTEKDRRIIVNQYIFAVMPLRETLLRVNPLATYIKLLVSSTCRFPDTNEPRESAGARSVEYQTAQCNRSLFYRRYR